MRSRSAFPKSCAPLHAEAQWRRAGALVMLLGLVGACDVAAPIEDSPAETTPEPTLDEPSMRVPVHFDAACSALAELPEAPADLTVADFFACLTSESRRTLGALYAKEALHRGAGPATLDELIARHADARIADVSLRELAFGAGRPREGLGEGAPPEAVLRYRFPSQYGLDPTTCASSCLSTYVSVVGGRRRIGFGPALKGAAPIKDDKNKRYLDEVYPGAFPDFRQADLANEDLQDAGCGPVSAINLFEWWGIPMYNGGTELTSFDARARYIANRMDTLDGLKFTDDEELIDFVTGYPREMQQAGRASGYPAYHYMRGDPEAWKVMMSYISRGYPVIALYATSSDSLHWALVTGIKGGKLLIANGGDRTFADFYNQWQDWQALDWYAEVAADLYVENSTFVALTGWGSSTPPPDRFAARTAKAYLPSYTSRSTWLFRYCVGALDEIGEEAEAPHVAPWTGEPSGRPPGYCLFTHPTGKLALAPRPTGGTASSASGAQLTLSVVNDASLSTFVNANPGARCYWYGQRDGAWEKLADRRCSEAAARSYGFTNTGQFTRISFHVHAPELARTVWKITVD